MMFSYVKFGALIAVSATIVNAFPSQKYKTEKFQVPAFQTRSFRGGTTDAGYLFLGLIHPKNPKEFGPIIVDNKGELVWHGPQGYNAYYNFQNQKVGGKDRLTWWNGYLEPSGHGYGHVVVMDHQYKQVKKICFPASVNIVTPKPEVYPGNATNPCFVDKHESIATNRNSIIVTAYNATQTDLTMLGGQRDGWVYDCLFYELDLDTNEILFRWSALEHVPVTKSNFKVNGPNPLLINGRVVGQDQSDPWDYFHINSVQAVPGGYIANSRMTWALYKINGQTGDLDWTLEGSNGGDFKLKDPIFFSWQHNPRLESQSRDGKRMQIHLFNNDNIPNVITVTNASSGYRLDVNTETMKVHKVADLMTQPTGPIYATAEGSVQGLKNGHHLVGYGSQPYIEEYNNKNQLVYFAQFGAENVSTHAYRTYRLPWVGLPKYKPKVVAKVQTNHTVDVYMSWNGATGVGHWNVYAGKTPAKLHRVARHVLKEHFETLVSVTPRNMQQLNYVMVEALDHKKKSLSKSSPVRLHAS